MIQENSCLKERLSGEPEFATTNLTPSYPILPPSHPIPSLLQIACPSIALPVSLPPAIVQMASLRLYNVAHQDPSTSAWMVPSLLAECILHSRTLLIRMGLNLRPILVTNLIKPYLRNLHSCCNNQFFQNLSFGLVLSLLKPITFVYSI